MPSTTTKISTRRHKQVLDITDRVQQAVSESGVQSGLCNIFVTHTTAGITTGESIEGTDEDLMEVLERLIPEIKFRHEHDPSHAPDHMISSILGPSVTVPIRNGKLQLGTWQSVLFVECNGPRERNVVITMVPT
ncbi:MAG TPA: secondary thiamine-phosphate synthase enzyme YjbQ [Blastocatellia bacterium]|jgi:secondary thiamine-phosphate synthase enzyme